MTMVNISVNGLPMQVSEGSSIYEAVNSRYIPYAEIEIPNAFYMKDIHEYDESGITQVSVEGIDGLVDSTKTIVSEGMKIETQSQEAVAYRKEILQKILETHDHDCVNCLRTDNCELQKLLYQYRVDDPGERLFKMAPIDTSSIIIRDSNKCIRCGRCATVCNQTQTVDALVVEGEGIEKRIHPAAPGGLADTKCVHCGQCVSVCPVGALREKDDTDEVFAAIADPKKFVVVQTAPSVRVVIGEEFMFPLGVDVEGRMAAALRRLGFDKVFDTDFGADLTIMEEANEFIDRMKKGENLPLMTSCCPGWIKFCEQEFPEMLENLSSCKSPHQMLGSIVKTYYTNTLGLKAEDIVVVSVMPCTAKKFEIGRDDENAAGVSDVDYAITTRELARMLKKADIQFEAMPAEDFDNPLGTSTGAGVIFGATGGVMEAALRTAVETLTGESVEQIEYAQIRGVEGIKEAILTVGDTTVRVAAVSGLGNARTLLNKIKSGESAYDFIEVMACPGGCVNGGGQPIQSAITRQRTDLRAARGNALYANDANKVIRKSHENPAIQTLYKEFLEVPGSHKAHELLHTTYVDRSR